MFLQSLQKLQTTPSPTHDPSAEKVVTFKVRALLIVRNKNQEDFKEEIVKKFDAFADQIGRNVVLELYSTDIDPSRPTVQ
ncbi:hypothetical protein L6452_18726 [Arctium lappa]|uniref:Uncharacterized protein n=1 Tax=Arctium lappa TaxID=4217 RepID=A0ACB9C740_ARCLA|nr:hypothetical protein L6452_18726 [Arctium lappa]